ncbi:MerR family transcriptional regulator [Streptococcus equinus]|uniref:MerR family transcriptional regulator n=1 Tax=Streptococcus equinus TaxID=1335 RepID=UPI00237AF160|nr:MerR family transcriptional regulator [Streptococcus equinus]
MSQTYTTGDLAKLAGVSVRTVQYYDKRGILVPSQLSEGGRRIYSESDLEKLRLICFLRELDFSIEQIKRLYAEENAKQVLELLLVEHIKAIKQQLAEKKAKLDTAVNLLDRVKTESSQSLEFLSDISLTMKNQLAWRRLQKRMWISNLATILIFVLCIAWLVSRPQSVLLQGVGYGICLIYIVTLLTLSYHFSRKVAYICPNCHHVFQPNFKTFFFAPHTPKTRKLTCPHCHEKSYCIETAKEV